MFFLFLESTQNAVLHRRVLNKTSLKWQPWILIHWCSVSRYLFMTLRIISGVMAATSCRIAVCLFQCRTVCLKCDTQRKIVFLSGTVSRRPSAKRMRNAGCVATGDPPFLINSSKIKARCSPDHAMVFTENGTYFAVRRRAPHYCRRSLPEAMPLTNRWVLSATLCILWSDLCFFL